MRLELHKSELVRENQRPRRCDTSKMLRMSKNLMTKLKSCLYLSATKYKQKVHNFLIQSFVHKKIRLGMSQRRFKYRPLIPISLYIFIYGV